MKLLFEFILDQLNIKEDDIVRCIVYMKTHSYMDRTHDFDRGKNNIKY